MIKDIFTSNIFNIRDSEPIPSRSENMTLQVFVSSVTLLGKCSPLPTNTSSSVVTEPSRD